MNQLFFQWLFHPKHWWRSLRTVTNALENNQHVNLDSHIHAHCAYFFEKNSWLKILMHLIILPQQAGKVFSTTVYRFIQQCFKLYHPYFPRLWNYKDTPHWSILHILLLLQRICIYSLIMDVYEWVFTALFTTMRFEKHR